MEGKGGISVKQMKKLGLLMLVLILALGALGIGYAKWSDTVTITGNVATGNVAVGILDISGGIFSDEGVDPRVIPGDGGEVFVFVDEFDKDVATATSQDVGDPVCVMSNRQFVTALHETFDQVYPFYAPVAAALLVNCGTLPIKIETVTLANLSDDDFCMSHIQWQWAIGGGEVTAFGTMDEMLQALELIQVEPGETLVFVYQPVFLEETPQGAALSFDFLFGASQWNEVAP
jgi:predicted ribosomally synthesized peptide with SipW-like signal peptide